MKKCRQGIKTIGKYLIAFLAVALIFSFGAMAEPADNAEYDFDTVIESFPESYRPYLEELHAKHPQWVFLPFETGLDWYETVAAQYGDEALVQNSITADILKSHDADDYNPANGTFVYKDGGFVQASELAVEYFLDPRNFLNEDGIFQFEMLSFDEMFTVQAIESILKGSFMSNAKISYLDAQGNTVTTDETYAEVIYKAGYTHDINPCYLASKILNEVGTDGSYSVWGNHAAYPGIYNFYNIGATDGVNAITRGLAWANGGADGKLKTYSRPWTSPEKSIMGGAEFLASSYIAVGQFTGYLQRFNVNPDSLHKVNTHQFMTNLTGAFSQGYTAYTSYVKQGIIDNRFIFSIPIFENMPISNDTDSIVAVDSKIQYGSVNTNGVNIRTGPSTTYARLQTKSGAYVLLNKGTSVKIQKKLFVDSDYYARILQYPIWYEIRFEYGSETYTGYILADYVDIESVTNVGKGVYDLGIFKSSEGVGGRLMTSNPSVCRILDDNTVEFLRVGEAYVTVYNSRGLCDRIKFRVNDSIDAYSVKEITVTSELESIKITLLINENAERYGFYLADSQGRFVKGGDITPNAYTFKNLQSDSNYTVYCRYIGSYCYDNGPLKGFEVSTKAKIEPDAPKNLSITDVTTKGFTLNWECDDADGYRVYRYRPEKGAYEVFKDVTVNSVVNDDLTPAYSCAFRIKAYKIIDGKRVYSDYSPLFWALTPPDKVNGLSANEVTSDSVTLSWNSVKGADSYMVYLVDGDESNLLYEGTDNSCRFDGALPFTDYYFYVIATVSERNNYAESIPSDILTVKTKHAVIKGFSVSDVTADSYTVSWPEQHNAIGYNIYRLDDGVHNLIASVIEPFCEFSELENSAKNFYKVSVLYDGTDDVYEGELSEEFSATTLPDKVEGIIGTAYEDKVELSWNAVKNADCYNVYLQENGKYVLKKTVTTNSYVLEGLEDITDYSVRVRAYIRSSLGTQKGKISTYNFTTRIKVVSGFKVSSVTDKTCVLSWEPSSAGVNRYNIYKYDASGKNYSRVAYTKGETSVTLKNLRPGSVEKFFVIAYIMDGSTIVARSYNSEDVEVATNLSKVTSLNGTNSSQGVVELTWDEVDNASYYRVYMYDSSKGEYVLLGSPKSASYKVSGLVKGNNYKFKVRAIGKSGSVAFYGYYSSVLTVPVKK